MPLRALRLYKINNKYGYKDKDTGETIILPLYENGKEFPIIIDNRNYLAVKKNGKWGLINEDNDVVVDFNYDEIGRPKLNNVLPEFVLCFRQQGDGYFKMGIISDKLQVTIPPVLDYFPENITAYGKNTRLYYIRKGDKWGIVKSDGTVAMEPEYDKEEVEAWVVNQSKNLDRD